MKKRYAIVVVCCALVLAAVISAPKWRKKAVQSRAGNKEVEFFSFSPGDSLYDCLSAQGLPDTVIYPVVKTLSETFDPRRCKPGDRYRIEWTENREFSCFEYWPDPQYYYVVRFDGETYSLKKEQLQLRKSIIGAGGRIETNLWEAMRGQGISPDLIMRLTDIFECNIDFLTEPRKGDIYRLIWERYSGENGLVIEDKILGAMYRGEEAGVNLAIFFNGHYYDSDGKALERQFLRAPLNYRRISSYFSYRRFHPILRYFRPHLGIDYAAPAGTPVVSIGDGTVVFKGWKGANGNLVMVRHDSVYTSSYGHLSRFGKGIRSGVRVKKGQVIGYVGMTGLATGPHLDFRVKKYGTPINYLRLKFPPLKSIEKKDMPAFEETKKAAFKLLSAVRGQIQEVSPEEN